MNKNAQGTESKKKKKRPWLIQREGEKSTELFLGDNLIVDLFDNEF